MSKVELLETLGNDLTVVNAARVSFDKESHEMTSKDEKLIAYLAKNNHVSPFFHPQIRFRIKMPLFVAREWFRHTIGFARNEVSRRYVDSKPEIYIPSEWRQRDANLKQGSKEELVANNAEICSDVRDYMTMILELYERLLKDGVCPEQARIVLPQGMYTEFIETGSLAAYARLCRLRLDPHAQKEIRVYAQQISDLLQERFPVSWKALMAESLG